MSRHISTSLRLTLWFGGIFFLGSLLFGVGMWANLRSTLRNERNLTLARRLDRLEDLLANDQSNPEADRYQDFADFAHATGNGLVEIMRPDGSRVYPSPSASAKSFPWPEVRSGSPDRFIHVQAAGQHYWVLTKPFTLAGQAMILMAAAPEAGNLLVMRSFAWGLIASIPILLLVSSAGGYWLSRRALKPVDGITATARSISITNISERIPVFPTGDELQRLAETCNAMLDRLESSVKQIKQFTADASHELRGPLSFTRTVAEVALKNPGVDRESRQALEDIVDEAAKAAVLLEDMLTLARADSLPMSVSKTPVSLVEVLEQSCDLAQPFADQRSLQLVRQFSRQDFLVLGDGASLKRLTWILLDNAIKYSKELGTVQVTLSGDANYAKVEISDDGIGIPSSDLPFIFNRFYRADPSRGMVEGNGLGLAIAKWIADTHEAEITVASEEGKGATFSMMFDRCVRQAPVELESEPHLMRTELEAARR